MERLVVTAEIIGVPAPGVAVWRSTDDDGVTGDLDDAPAAIGPGDLVVLRIERSGFRWVPVELVEHLPAGGARARPAAPSERPRRPHAHPARPPGTVLIAWLPFSREDDAPGKHRPCVVLHSSDPDVVRVRPLFDAGSAHVRRHGGVPVRGWRTAGLDKASVAVAPVDVPVNRCEQTLGSLDPHDRGRLGLDRR